MPTTPIPIPDLLLHWLHRTQLAGLDIVAVATHQLPVIGNQDFINISALASTQFTQRPTNLTQTLTSLLSVPEDDLENISNTTPVDTGEQHHTKATQTRLATLWQSQLAKINVQQPIKVQRIEDLVLISCLIISQEAQSAYIGCLIAPPFHQHMLDLLQLSLGWLFYGFVIAQHPEGERAKRLLNITSDILDQPDAKSAAQAWVNQAKQWANEMGHEDVGISLFQVIANRPKWWVSANIAWAVKGSAVMQQANELAAMAILEGKSQTNKDWWVYPMHHQGQTTAVLLLDNRSNHKNPIQDDELLLMLQASADLFEPILRQWRKSEQSLVHHGYHSSTSLMGKLLGRGYLDYKLIVLLLTIVLLAITLIPVDDIVTAPLYIEGDKRYTVTAPQQSYIIEVLARPGDNVKQGQIIAKLEDKDLKMEASDIQSQLEQTEGQFRQAMADMDAANSGLAVNQKQQAQSKLDLINRKIARTIIKSPIDGVVVSGDWQQKIGTPIEEGAELFQVADVASYRVILHVPDKDMDRLQIGETGKMKLTSLPDQTFDFTVRRLTAVAEVKDGENGFSVEASLNATPTQINPGMQGVGKVKVGKTNLITLWTRNLIDWVRLKLWSVF
ncbi:efflux RND transporter periplasmic adaptor subunit [Moraxella oblonga]|uniref:efflux RND transporter periplasmic adaptor subunit n=1 Tax=Moraxella oblonga TaxID=200413 RepID=UPI000836E0DD|nr:HlyD family efflux transporter periplasmic adaptor subunit [Moraxella oblonga]